MINIWPPVECDDQEERLTAPFSKMFVLSADIPVFKECTASLRTFPQSQKIFIYYCGVQCRLTVRKDGENAIEIQSTFEDIVDDSNRNGEYGKQIEGSSAFQVQEHLGLPITRQFHYAPINPVYGLTRTLRVNGEENVPIARTLITGTKITALGSTARARYEFEDPDDECQVSFGFGGLADKSFSLATQYIGGFTNTCHGDYLRFLNWPETPEEGIDFFNPVRPSYPNISNAQHKLLIEYGIPTKNVSIRLSPTRNINPGGLQKRFFKQPNASEDNIADFIKQGYEYTEVCGSGGIYVKYW